MFLKRFVFLLVAVVRSFKIGVRLETVSYTKKKKKRVEISLPTGYKGIFFFAFNPSLYFTHYFNGS